MGIFTHAIFDQCGNFKDWMTYIDGGYSLKAGELIEDCWGSKRVSELEKFLGEQHRAVPFDELTEADWLIIRRAKASNEQAQ